MSGPEFGWQPRAPGTTLATRYLVTQVLKLGGMSAVYLAQDHLRDGQVCVVKELLDPATSDTDRLERRSWFAREAQLLHSLTHPAIPAIFDSFADSGRYYLAMEYIAGENLEDRLLRAGTPGLPELEVMEWAAQICEPLFYLHSHNPPIVFRDLKPENLMLTPKGKIRLVDFGIARVFSPVQQHTMVGTPGYCPPEQYQGLAEPLSDLYALAASLHHLLTGQDPREHSPFSFGPVRVLAPAVSEATEQLLLGALRLELDQRGPPVDIFGQRAWHIANALRQGQQPAPSGSRALFAPGDPLAPTHMIAPAQGIQMGKLPGGKQHQASLPISNKGPAELRVTLHTTAAWLQLPEGQVRVPCNGEALVPFMIDAVQLPAGPQHAIIELDGNGGRILIPLDVYLTHWLLNGMTTAMGIALTTLATLLVLSYLLAHLL
jgi:serine/threonine-protein kinase